MFFPTAGDGGTQQHRERGKWNEIVIYSKSPEASLRAAPGWAKLWHVTQINLWMNLGGVRRLASDNSLSNIFVNSTNNKCSKTD